MSARFVTAEMRAASERYFAAIAAHVGGVPDREGELWLACPSCRRQRKHFSVHAERGAKCVACGYAPSLRTLAETLGVDNGRYAADSGRAYAAPAWTPAPSPPKPWQLRAGALAESLAQTPGTLRAWQAYKPMSADMVSSRRLGYGVFPGGLWSHKTGACAHPRLIVPIYRDGAVTGFRCRAVACACSKWLSPGGSKLWLYEIERVRAGAEAWIVENPIDALLLQAKGYQAVATFGASIWNDAYTAAVVAARPAQVIVAGDHDDAGRAMNERVTRALRLAHLPAEAYAWPAGTPEHYDIGQLLAEGASA